MKKLILILLLSSTLKTSYSIKCPKLFPIKKNYYYCTYCTYFSIMTDKDNNDNSFPLWQKILYGFLALVVLMLLLWFFDKIGLLGFLAGAGI